MVDRSAQSAAEQRAALGWTIGELVEQAREVGGLSQVDLAALAGTSQSHISMLASGDRGLPASDVLDRLREVREALDDARDAPPVLEDLKARARRARQRSGPGVPSRPRQGGQAPSPDPLGQQGRPAPGPGQPREPVTAVPASAAVRGVSAGAPGTPGRGARPVVVEARDAGAVDDVPTAAAGLLELTELRLENRRLRRTVAAMSRSQAALLRAHQELLESLGDMPVDGVGAAGDVEGR